MADPLNPGDLSILRLLAEHRILSIPQLTALTGRHMKSIHRRSGALRKAGLILSGTVGFGRKHGRPEQLISLSDAGIKALRDAGVLAAEIPDHQVNADRIQSPDHEHLLNWARVHLARIPTINPQLVVGWLFPPSPWCLGADPARSGGLDAAFRSEGPDASAGFVPDGVFFIAHAATNKAVLFFLEVDMGSETLGSPQGKRSDLRQKITNYREHFQSGRHKAMEAGTDYRFNGFRLLFLANSTDRVGQISRLVRSMPPSDFIWSTDQGELLSKGLWAKIWAKGSDLDTPRQSFLDSKLPDPCPLPPWNEQ